MSLFWLLFYAHFVLTTCPLDTVHAHPFWFVSLLYVLTHCLDPFLDLHRCASLVPSARTPNPELTIVLFT
jgi:hypothetical protein